ncbi:MAPEG family protein [Alteromonas aestuariivivens]|uniref:MAPEG family protein n=1 Tax=Alteromonas aestuariivivens TaxID=1938339 RepID=A0A3D8M4H3_9ALTE|nr:MAPEG family protein [Alteromonas aestuariivivens]RDV24556.1 MAPEG family protein [Alteromonas aestuariivivens]
MPPIIIVLFITALLPYVLAPIGAYFRVKEFGKFDNHHPRMQQAMLTGAGARAIAAHKNAWEALAMLTAVLVIAIAGNVDLNTLTMAGYVFLTARILHAALYLANLATLRTLAFVAGWVTCIYIFYLAVTTGHWMG